MRDELGVAMNLDEINRAVVDRMEQHYREHLPLLPGALEAARRLGIAPELVERLR